MVKTWIWQFSHLRPGHTAGGQKVDNLRTCGNPKLGHLLTKCHNCPKMHLYHSISGLGKDRTYTRLSNPEIIQTLSSICLKIVHLWNWAMVHGPPITHSLPTWDKLWTNLGQRLDKDKTLIFREHQLIYYNEKSFDMMLDIEYRIAWVKMKLINAYESKFVYVMVCPLPTACPPLDHCSPTLAQCSPTDCPVLAQCSPTAGPLLAQCLLSAHHLLTHCSPSAHPLFAQCLPTAREVLAQCLPSARPLLAQCLPTPSARPLGKHWSSSGWALGEQWVSSGQAVGNGQTIT